MLLCIVCGIEKSLNNFCYADKEHTKKDKRCNECLAQRAQEIRDKVNLQKYYDSIKKDGYFIKKCNFHGGLEYKDIRLRIRCAKEPYHIELKCIKCITRINQRTYDNRERFHERMFMAYIFCTSCKNELNIAKYTTSGLKQKHPVCQLCQCQRSKDFHKENSLFSKYGITQEDYQKMHDQQKGLCAICNNPEVRIDGYSKQIGNLCVDHCHKTGKIRGLLCHLCNTAIGKFKDNPELLKSAAKYLESHA